MSKTKSEKKQKSVVRKIFNGIIYLVLIASVILFAFVFIMKVQGRPAFIFGKAFMFVETGSMERDIPAQSFILVDKADASEVQVGDVITFISRSSDPRINGQTVTHRVIEIIGNNEQFVTKGDANIAQDDYYTAAEDVLGKYNKNVGLLTFLARGLSKPQGLLIAITFICILALVAIVPDFNKSAKESEKEVAENREAMLDAAVKAEVARMMAEKEKEKPAAQSEKEADESTEEIKDNSESDSEEDTKENTNEDNTDQNQEEENV